MEKHVNNLRLLLDAVTCPAMLAIMFMEFANSWGLTILLTYGPTFMQQVLNFNIQENGLLSSLPWLSRFIFAQFIAYLSGHLIRKRVVSHFNMQKLNSVLATLVPGIGMVWFSFTFMETQLQKLLVVSPLLSPHLVHLVRLVKLLLPQKHRGAPLPCHVPLLQLPRLLLQALSRTGDLNLTKIPNP